MPLTRFVKVGNISNLSDARYCAGMGVDLLGFQVVESQKNHITANQFQEIRGWITGPRIVAEVYGITKAEDIQSIIQNYRPDLVELGTDELDRIGDPALPFILSVDAKDVEKVKSLSVKPDYILIKDFRNDVTVPLTSPALIELASIKLEDIQPNYLDWGIALNGSAEISPGLKSYDDLSEVLEKLDAD